MSPRSPSITSGRSDSTAVTLATQIRARDHFIRAANVERDSGDRAGDYVPTPPAIDLLGRFAATLVPGAANRAWAVTGPYGSGKSSFALHLDALLGAQADPARRLAMQTLRRVAPEVQHNIVEGLAALGTPDRGFIRAVVTAQREPVAATIARAFHRGAQRYWPRAVPRTVSAALKALTASISTGGVDALLLADVVSELTQAAPLLIVIDEFGKNLEHFTEQVGSTDLFPLQVVAERAAAVPAFVLTLQHLGFDDYASMAIDDQRREWAKVQGRFEEVPFVGNVEQTVRLVSAVLDRDTTSAILQQRIGSWASKASTTCGDMGLGSVVDADDTDLAACYPLHPISLFALPELCARYGQHDRTLFGFLTSDEPHSVAEFIARTAVGEDGSLPTVMLDQVYDYFFSAGIPAVAGSSRWVEIDTRIREAHRAEPEDLRCLKAIGLLNLISQGGALRASPALVAYALTNPDATARQRQNVISRLRGLEDAGLVTYRHFADEYRIWQGTDFDIQGALKAARREGTSEPLAPVLSRVSPLGPVVAARHSQTVGMLRYFVSRYASSDGPFDTTLPDGADGLILYVLGNDLGMVQSAIGQTPHPVLAVATAASAKLDDAARELSAVLDVLGHDGVGGDWVARRELQERASTARVRLSEIMVSAFRASAAEIVWADAGKIRKLPGSKSASQLVSDVCDSTYPQSPHVHNEMLGRRELSSQGAKARRELMEAMVLHATEERLGIEGYGPDRAMYEAVLRFPGIHRPTPDGNWTFGQPEEASSYAPAWRAICETVDAAADGVVAQEIYDVLSAAPFGMKDGPIPVLLLAVLLYRADDIAIYQDGTYEPRLSPDVFERMLKAPHRFTLKSFAFSPGQKTVLGELAKRGLVQPRFGATKIRNPAVVTLAAGLIGRVRALPEFSRNTKAVSVAAQGVREAISTSQEPDDLLLRSLPAALGLGVIPRRTSEATTYADAYVAVLDETLRELDNAYNELLHRLVEAMARTLELPGNLELLRADLGQRARRLRTQVIERRLRAFLTIAADASLDDHDWLEAIALAVADRPAPAWQDHDTDRCIVALKDIAGAFQRIEALHIDVLATSGNGFDAKRITVTEPDGHETARVVWVDGTIAEAVAVLANNALDKARQQFGDRGLAALLVAVADAVISTNKASDTVNDQAELQSRQTKRRARQ
jgi:uncharacterized membrane protein